MWELDCEESGELKIDAFELWCWRRLLRVPLDSKEIQPVHPKGDQSWVFVGRTDAEAETPIPWSPHAKSWLIGKDSDVGRDWGQEEKGTTEDKMAGWHHQLDGRVWVNSGSWWWTGRLGVLRFMGSQRVRHDWVTELNWSTVNCGFGILNIYSLKKNPDAGKDSRREEKGTTEDEMAGWHHRLDGRVWVNSGSWWWTGRPGMLQSMGSQRVGHNWANEMNWISIFAWNMRLLKS